MVIFKYILIESVFLWNLLSIARPETPIILDAVRRKDGVYVTWETPDYGGLGLLSITYNWKNEYFQSLNICMISIRISLQWINLKKRLLLAENQGEMIKLTDVPMDANNLQISLENKLGLSPLSNLFTIKCGFNGCKSQATAVISASVVSVVVVVSLVVLAIFIIQKSFFLLN